MKIYWLILGAGCLPGLIAILFTFPLLYIRHLTNESIRLIGIFILFIALVAGYIPSFLDPAPIGILVIPASFVNLLLFYWYERFLYTRRCPECRRMTLHTRARHKKGYKLSCRQCKLTSYWQPWQSFSNNK